MYKVAILGVENSHAEAFLEEYKNTEYGVEIVGIYSDEDQAVKSLSEKYGVKIMENYDELAGKADGIIITARHGDNHYKYAKPYIKYGIPMFIDKPITCSEKDAADFMNELCANNIRICGGSIVPLAPEASELSRIVAEKSGGEILGGSICCPVSLCNDYGDFYFYSQHLAESLLKIFGANIQSVYAKKRDNAVSVIASYPEFDVVASFLERGYKCYAASVYTADAGVIYRTLNFNGKSFAGRFADILSGKDCGDDYDSFIKPVALINAIKRSFESGKTETVNLIRGI